MPTPIAIKTTAPTLADNAVNAAEYYSRNIRAQALLTH